MRTIHPSALPRPPRARTLIAAAAMFAAVLLPALAALPALPALPAAAAQAPPPQESMIKGSVTITNVYGFQNNGETLKETSTLTVTVMMQSQTDVFGNVDWVDAGGGYDAKYTYKDSDSINCPYTTTANASWSRRFGGKDGTINYFPPDRGGPSLYVNVPDVPVTYNKKGLPRDVQLAGQHHHPGQLR